MYLNHVQLIGFLGKDPEKRQVRGNGANFTVLSVATQQSWKDSKDEWQSKTEWHRVVAFNRLGESSRNPCTRAITSSWTACSSARSTSARTASPRRPRPPSSASSGAFARTPCAGSAARKLMHHQRPARNRVPNQERRRSDGARCKALRLRPEGLFFCPAFLPTKTNLIILTPELQRIRLRRSLPALGGDTAPVPPRDRCLSLCCSKSSRAGPLSDSRPSLSLGVWGVRPCQREARATARSAKSNCDCFAICLAPSRTL